MESIGLGIQIGLVFFSFGTKFWELAPTWTLAEGGPGIEDSCVGGQVSGREDGRTRGVGMIGGRSGGAWEDV